MIPRKRLDALFAPKSIAILGASEKPSIAQRLIVTLERLGFAGDVLPVNPRHRNILGHPCYPSLGALPVVPDVVVFCLGPGNVRAPLRECADLRVPAAVIYSGGFAEQGDDGLRLQAEIESLCREAEIALCGPNCMGVLNVHARCTTYAQELLDLTGLAGNVGFISQSGAICMSLTADLRRFGFSQIVSSGNEAVVALPDFLDYLIDDPNTKIIAMFLETVRRPDQFVAALDRAAARGKPVVVLKVGRTTRTQQAITSHTGGLAGESRVFSELLRAHRAIEVSDLGEMSEVLAVAQGARQPKGRKIGIVTSSGGQSELILDVATAAGLDLPPLTAADRDRADELFGSITGDGNPLDAWGNGTFVANLPKALDMLGDSVNHDAVLFCRDNLDGQTMDRPELAFNYVKTLAAASTRSDKPHYLLSTRPGMLDRQHAAYLREFGVPVVTGIREGLGAIDRLARHLRPRAEPRLQQGLRGGGLAALLRPNGARPTIHEYDAKRLLASHGVPTVVERLVQSLDEAVEAAKALGYPVVLKVVSDDIAHKTDRGLVALALKSESELREAWSRLARRVVEEVPRAAIAGFLVQSFVSGGSEVFVGVKSDPDFGPVLAFGMGGIAIELLQDFALRMLPLREGDAEAMIGEVRGAVLLDSVRGGARADKASLARCIDAIADYAWADRALIGELDLNPIKVMPEGQGCVALDALIVPSIAAGG